jgi:hypothetical protein
MSFSRVRAVFAALAFLVAMSSPVLSSMDDLVG